MTDPLRVALIPVLALGLVCSASAAGQAQELAVVLARHYRSAEPIGADDLAAVRRPADLEQAASVRDAWLDALRPWLGPDAGYKVALTNGSVQARFGVDSPVLGRLTSEMLRSSPARIDPAGGARLVMEADLLLRWDCAGVPKDRGDRGLLECISHVIPFIEVADLMYEPGVSLDAADLVAIDAGARYGVMGRPIAVQATSAWFERLKAFRVELSGEGVDGVLYGSGSDLMDHPLAVLRWLVGEVSEHDMRLAPGYLISLGSLTPPLPVPAAGLVQARYHGLDPDGVARVEVEFDPDAADRRPPTHPHIRPIEE